MRHDAPHALQGLEPFQVPAPQFFQKVRPLAGKPAAGGGEGLRPPRFAGDPGGAERVPASRPFLFDDREGRCDAAHPRPGAAKTDGPRVARMAARATPGDSLTWNRLPPDGD